MNRLAICLVVSLASACSASVIHGTGVGDAGTVEDAPQGTVPDAVSVADGSVTMPPTPIPPSDGGPAVACPGTLAGNGLACASPGAGCATGGGGGGPCMASVSCTCGGDLRWRCMETAQDCDAGGPATTCPGGPDGSGLSCSLVGQDCSGSSRGGGSYTCVCRTDLRWACSGTVPPPPPPDAGVCSLVGIWTVQLRGITAYFRFEPSANWEAATSVADLDAMPAAGGTYSVTDSRLTLNEGLRGAGSSGCVATATGVYNLAFTPSCASVTLHLVSEACPQRGTTLSGTVLSRP